MTSSVVDAAAAAASALPEAAPPRDDDRLAALVRIMPAVVYSVSPIGNFISGQSSWHAFTGRSYPDSADTGWLQAYHEDDRPKLFARFAAAAHPAPSDVWYTHARLWSVKHAEHRRMLCRSFLIRDSTTHLPREWLSVDVEIASPPAQQQQTCAPTSSLLYLSLACAPTGSFTFVLRSDLGIVSVSLDEDARRLTDPPLPSSMSFDEWLSFIHHEDQAALRVLFSDTTLCCSSAIDFRFKAGGSDRWVNLRGSVHSGDDAEPGAETPRLLGVLSDVTEVIRQEELRRARLQSEHARAVDLANSAEELRRQQQEFVDTICHEIRNPLQGIVGAVQIMREELSQIEASLKGSQHAGTTKNGSSPFPSLYAHLDTITECARLQRIITDDVLEMSRLAAGVSQLALEAFPLRRLFTSLRSVFAAVVDMRHLTFTMRVVNITLESDYTRLSQIIANLLSAVLKFTQERGVITLSASVVGEQRDTLCVTIEDQNLSLNDAQLTKLMERFSAAPPATAGATAGSFGLGLSIARRHLDLLRGSVTYTSGEGGRGTRITMRVPVAKVADVAPRVASPVAAPWSHTRQLPRQLHVLLVEDNAVIRTILERLVRSVGCTYQSAENGAEAAEIYRKTLVPFDAVLMDFRMPVMNGIEATRRIRQIEDSMRRPRTRIIGLTGDTRREQKEEAMQAGMDDYLTKPYQRDEVLSALANCPPPAPIPLTDGTNAGTGGTGPAPAVSPLS